MSWMRWQFWLFAGVVSWAGAPFFEELFYRGYCQRRLAEDWGDGPAIFGAAFLFTFSHSQYLKLDPYHAGMTIGLLLSAIGFGAVFAWTRSLIPAMIAHAIFDVPLTAVWQGVLLAGLILGTAVARPQAIRAIRKVFSSASVVACAALGARSRLRDPHFDRPNNLFRNRAGARLMPDNRSNLRRALAWPGSPLF